MSIIAAIVASHTGLPLLRKYIQLKKTGNTNHNTQPNTRCVNKLSGLLLICLIINTSPRRLATARNTRFSYGWGSQTDQIHANIALPEKIDSPNHQILLDDGCKMGSKGACTSSSRIHCNKDRFANRIFERILVNLKILLWQFNVIISTCGYCPFNLVPLTHETTC